MALGCWMEPGDGAPGPNVTVGQTVCRCPQSPGVLPAKLQALVLLWESGSLGKGSMGRQGSQWEGLGAQGETMQGGPTCCGVQRS